MKCEYDSLPEQFSGFAVRNSLRDSSRKAFARRKFLAELIGLRPNLLSSYLLGQRGKHVTTTNLAKVRAVLRAAGDMRKPKSAREGLEHLLGLGLVDYSQISAALLSKSPNIFTRLMHGDWKLSELRLEKLETFLKSQGAAVAGREQQWQQRLLDAGFTLADRSAEERPTREVPAASPEPRRRDSAKLRQQPPPPAAPAAAEAAATTPPAAAPPSGGVGNLVEIVAAIINGACPILDALIERGGPEDFRRLRQLTVDGPVSNRIYKLKLKLSRLCSDRAMKITANTTAK